VDTLILTNGTVYADTGTIENGYVVISGERITTIAEGTPPADPEGKIIDVGSHQELIRRDTVYARLAELQFGAVAE